MMQTQSNNLFHAVASNNKGASLIDSGDFREALSSLSLALKAAKSCMTEDERNGEGHHEVPFGMDSFMTKVSLQESNIEDGFYVYDQPIRIPAQDTNSVHKVVCSAAAIFNLALAHHLFALSNQTNNSSLLLQKAGKLYEFGLQVQQGAPQAEEQGMEHASTLFYLACLNNLTDVHRRLDNSTAAQKYGEDLLQLLMFLTDTQLSAKEEAVDAFYQNTFFYLLSARGVNAAAAA